MDRKDQIRKQVNETVFDIASSVSNVPVPAILAAAALAAKGIGKFMGPKKSKPAPPLGTPKVKPRGIPGILSIDDPRQRN